MSRFSKPMEAMLYIAKTREYLDYLEEHINNIDKAYHEVATACDDLREVSDDSVYFELNEEVRNHDVSKFSKEEFTQYRAKFFPIVSEGITENDFDTALEHHKDHNPHHWEKVNGYTDVFHMVVDWTAMGYKFGDTAQQYYELNSEDINLEPKWIEFMYKIFSRIGG